MHANSPTPNGPPPRPVFALQLFLLDNGQVAIQAPGEQPLDSPERVALAGLTCWKALQHFGMMPFAQPEGSIELAPPGAQVPRNPKA